jgi:hypothetical protein
MPPDTAAIDIFHLDFAMVDDCSTQFGIKQNNILFYHGLEKKRPRAAAFVIAI